MSAFARPRVVVSKCLGFAACRYNGQTIPDRFLERLAPHADLLVVCPEVEIGLGIPRDTIHIVGGDSGRRLVQPSNGQDLTDRMVQFRERFLGGLRDIDGFVLKGRSPSCAIFDAKIHSPRENTPALGKGPGIFAEGVLAGFPDTAIEDEGRLTNFRIREHFLARVFTTAAFRAVAAERDMGALVRFHAGRKLLLMGVNQTGMRALGRIVANHAKAPVAEVLAAYGAALRHTMARIPRTTSHVNVLMHAMGYFKDRLVAAEKRHFLDLLEVYRAGKLPLSAATAVMRSWIVRFSEEYLASQVYFEPYPPDLVEISDSGKGRGE